MSEELKIIEDDKLKHNLSIKNRIFSVLFLISFGLLVLSVIFLVLNKFIDIVPYHSYYLIIVGLLLLLSIIFNLCWKYCRNKYEDLFMSNCMF